MDYVCSLCHSSLINKGSIESNQDFENILCTNPECSFSKGGYFTFEGIPVLVPFDSELCVFRDRSQLNLSSGDKKMSTISTLKKAKKYIASLLGLFAGENQVTQNNYKNLTNHLHEGANVLVVGGGSRGSGSSYFYKHCNLNQIKIEEIDIFYSKYTTAIADAHYLPFSNATFDLVVIQAVLEHVLNPEKVVSEIYRVLTPNGILYAETPFMQSVHMEAYDFTRYTHSGHRWLFREFSELDSGSIFGLFASANWIFSRAIGSLFRSDLITHVISILFARLSNFLDSFITPSDNLDHACGLYFLGRKVESRVVKKTPSWIIEYYNESHKRITHKK